MKYLKQFFNWVKSLFKKEEEVSEEFIEEIPLQDAFRMWKEQQVKESEKPLSYGDALKRYLDSTNLFNNKQ